VTAARKLRVIGIIASAAGAAGMVGGQAIDLAAVAPAVEQAFLGRNSAAGGREGPDAAALEDMHARKTGALIRAAAVSGAVMAGGDAQTVGAIDAYAGHIGLAFQIVDDILDVEGQASELGKTVGKDAAAGKPTYPSLYGVDRSRALAADCLARAESSVRDAGLDAGRLVELAHWIGRRRA
jgi:geranylgeranyl pyrophosphate synthase